MLSYWISATPDPRQLRIPSDYVETYRGPEYVCWAPTIVAEKTSYICEYKPI